MKFEIEVKDFYLDGEELTKALKSHITYEVVNKISADIKDRAEQQIAQKVTETINAKIAPIIDSVLTDLVATGVIVRNKEEITIQDHIKQIFQQNHGWSNPSEQMKKIAQKFGDELKLQYNNIFANRIVQNLKEQGMLKDEVVQILLTNEKAK